MGCQSAEKGFNFLFFHSCFSPEFVTPYAASNFLTQISYRKPSGNLKD
jgi:hypothetical protein